MPERRIAPARRLCGQERSRLFEENAAREAAHQPRVAHEVLTSIPAQTCTFLLQNAGSRFSGVAFPNPVITSIQRAETPATHLDPGR
jgi:hypothetical protein